MIQYKRLVKHIRDNGTERQDRTGTGTRSVFGHQMRFNLQDGFPLVTTKKTFFRGAAEELLWMIRGETNVNTLQEKGIHIWDEWADELGELGPIYGHQWRSWGEAFPHVSGIDQLQSVIEGLQKDPYGRRHIISAWNPADLPEPGVPPHEQPAKGFMALAPCHTMFQFYVDKDTLGRQRLSCQLYQRSADVFLGVPFNIAGYALLTRLLAHHLYMVPGDFVHTFGDAHIYLNHLEQVDELLSRTPKGKPSVIFHHHPDKPLDKVTIEDIELIDYEHHPAIKAPVAV